MIVNRMIVEPELGKASRQINLKPILNERSIKIILLFYIHLLRFVK